MDDSSQKPNSADEADSEINELERRIQLNTQAKQAKYKRSNFPLLRSSSLLDSQRYNPILKKSLTENNRAAKRVNFSSDKVIITNNLAEESESIIYENNKSKIDAGEIENLPEETFETSEQSPSSEPIKIKRKKGAVKGSFKQLIRNKPSKNFRLE